MDTADIRTGHFTTEKYFALGECGILSPDDRVELHTFESLWRAYRECRRTKRGTLDGLAFEMVPEAGFFDLQEELRSHLHRPGTSTCFVTDGAKPREEFAADSGGRIVHHLLLARTEPLFKRRLFDDSSLCRMGKDVLGDSERLTP